MHNSVKFKGCSKELMEEKERTEVGSLSQCFATEKDGHFHRRRLEEL